MNFIASEILVPGIQVRRSQTVP